MIPNQYHFVFGLQPQRQPFHLLHYLCLASCIAVNRPARVLVHCRNRPWGPLWDRILPSIEVRPLAAADLDAPLRYDDPVVARYAYAHQADFVRLRVLLREGGVYADMDTIFIRPPPPALFAQRCVMGRETADPTVAHAAGGSLCNAMIMAEPGAAFIRLWLDRMQDAFDGSWSRHSCTLPHELSVAHPDLIRVEPEASFFALDWTPDGLADLFARQVALPPDSYSLHLWAHLWWDRARRDKSCFSADQVTPAFIRHADTTYARLARPFLPPGPRQSRLRHRIERLREIRPRDLMRRTLARMAA
jgi:hypothetical protein